MFRRTAGARQNPNDGARALRPGRAWFRSIRCRANCLATRRAHTAQQPSYTADHLIGRPVQHIEVHRIPVRAPDRPREHGQVHDPRLDGAAGLLRAKGSA